MKQKILGSIIIIAVLTFLSLSNYNLIYGKLEIENKQVEELIQTEEENQAEWKEFLPHSNNQGGSGEGDTADGTNISLHALSAALIDGVSGRVLYDKNGNDVLPMASTTKIMTCIIALENSQLDEIVTISRYASTMPDVQLTIREGEQYKLEDLLYSLMLESHNDVAVAIAEHVGGSVEGFAKMMNDKAKELGCENTNFVTPNGLDADGHSTTAVELARIASYAIKNKEFIKITNTAARQFSELNNRRSFSVTNKDKFLYMYDGAIGVKTGFTGKAGYCFVGAVVKDNKTLVTAVLASGWPPNRNFKWSDTSKLMDFGVKNFSTKTIFDGISHLKTIMVVNGIEKVTGTYVEGHLELLVNENDVIEYSFDIPETLVAPVQKGNPIGYMNIRINGDICASYPIKISKSIDKIDWNYCLDKVLKMYFLQP
jgi:D-alanyl-D-alanine carboxypeptidase (penicillin-binding protein 5/6)